MNKLYKVLIFLVFFGLGIPCASAANVTSLVPQTVETDMGFSQNIEIMKDDVSDGTLGSNNTFSALNSEVAEINMEPALTVSSENGTNSKLATVNVANPINWEFSPQEPVCGDIININGSASPEDKINAFVTFEKNVSVSEGEYEYSLQNVTIVKGLGNSFTVEARGVNNLNVRAKKVGWLSKSANASGDTAIVSRSDVPTGTYQIMIDGDAKEGVSEVDLKITASQTIQADSNGNFSYSYNTTAIPPGNFEVKVGDVTKEITLRSKEEPVLPAANFSTNVSEGYAPLSVQFNDSSKNATSISWNFGDETANSDERNPMHIYSAAGNYNVNLTASNEYGMNSTSVIINVFENKPFPGYTNPPIDSDHDNLCEDINGNGKVDFDDIVAYYANMNWIGENAPVTLFDYNNNNIIDFDDVVKLYNIL
ncbi:PKD domain-containing protein [Methanosarcina vacuolata]|nr:PKD domain-containing protein [Methanosarcina vacuolata]